LAKIKKMKKILFSIALSIASISVFSQTKEPEITGYVSGGLSMSGGSNDFKSMSYASIETGICYKNLGIGAIIGRASLENADFKNMFWEIKASPSKDLGVVTGYGVLGYGRYMDYRKSFIEYGLGMYWSCNKLSYFAQISDWDNAKYITLGLTYNFKFKKDVRNN